MSGGTITRCPRCSRLIIRGQKCPCPSDLATPEKPTPTGQEVCPSCNGVGRYGRWAICPDCLGMPWVTPNTEDQP